MTTKNKNNRALLAVISIIALLALTVALSMQSAWLRDAEFYEQIAKFGFYKKDVLLNYGRDVARTSCILGATLSGASAFLVFAIAVGIHK